jgi:hypothetical protein
VTTAPPSSSISSDVALASVSSRRLAYSAVVLAVVLLLLLQVGVSAAPKEGHQLVKPAKIERTIKNYTRISKFTQFLPSFGDPEALRTASVALGYLFHRTRARATGCHRADAAKT